MRHLQRAPLDLGPLLAETAGVDAGALVVFSGDVRRHDAGLELVALDYSAQEPMADAALARIEAEEGARPGILACRIVHRLGTVGAGETSVLVVVRGRHRAATFAAAEACVERLKAEVPIWKEDLRADGSRAWTAAGTPLRSGADDAP